MASDSPLRLFQGVGIELEYMIVDAATLDVRPEADALLREVGGGYDVEVAFDDVAWSNELALHVIEMKTNGPAPDLVGLGARFQEHVGRIDELLGPMGARLMPSAMHPWMDSLTQLKLWPHENNEIYQTFDRIFDCRGHGWANLQSMHINLPFGDDDEFGRLHAAIRVVLPILPALAASSPFADGRFSGSLDTRLIYYRDNARRVPSVSGLVIPEPVFSREAYEGELLAGIYRDLEPLDPDGVLRYEWVNARGCIARFDRDAIEIRVLDLQECPRADIAVAGGVIAAVRAMADERWATMAEQRSWHHQRLAAVLAETMTLGDEAVIEDREYLRLFGIADATCRAGDLWQHIVESAASASPGYDEWGEPLQRILRHGCLGRRLVAAAGREPSAAQLHATYAELCRCLRTGQLFDPGERG